MSVANLIVLLIIVAIYILWKLKKIHIRFNFSPNAKNEEKTFEIDKLLKEIDKEITVAAQAFFAWKSIHNTASKDADIKKNLDSNALSWNICLHSLQATFFIAIGRIFDTNPQSCSIHLLFRQCKNSIKKFNKSSLRLRRIEEAGETPDYLNDFISRVYEPKEADFKKLKKNVARVQNIYEEHFRPIRHKVFAHNDSEHISNTSALFSSSTIEDAEDILKPDYHQASACFKSRCGIGNVFTAA